VAFSLQQCAQLLQPDIVVGGSAIALPPEPLLERGIAGLILDIDETIVSTYSSELSAETREWLKQMESHFQLWLVSNNWNGPRIRQIARAANLPYIDRAVKPSRRSLRRAIASMNLPPQQVAIVGDRLLTDVLAGNRLGLVTVLVEPLRKSTSLAYWSPERLLSHLWGINLKKTL
jgi:HAD superfamily phosphatase (TIGR01668 family)